MTERWEWPNDGKDHYREPNPASDPEACGLEIIDTLSVPDLSYEFDEIILWRDKASGKFYAAGDSGCSCPTPFENYHSLGDLTEIPDEEALRAFVNSAHSGEYRGFALRDVFAFIGAFAAAKIAPCVSERVGGGSQESQP